MRLRITKPPSGNPDGLPLDRFSVGCTYDVGTALGNYLLASGVAEPDEHQTPALVVPINEAKPGDTADDKAARVLPIPHKSR